MTVRIGELRAFELSIEFGRAGSIEEVRFRPKTAQARRLRILIELSLLFGLRRIVLHRRIHLVAVGFVVPPHQPEIRGDHVLARMHVANHALRRRDARGELMLDRMTRLVLRNAPVG